MIRWALLVFATAKTYVGGFVIVFDVAAVLATAVAPVVAVVVPLVPVPVPGPVSAVAAGNVVLTDSTLHPLRQGDSRSKVMNILPSPQPEETAEVAVHACRHNSPSVAQVVYMDFAPRTKPCSNAVVWTPGTAR